MRNAVLLAGCATQYATAQRAKEASIAKVQYRKLVIDSLDDRHGRLFKDGFQAARASGTRIVAYSAILLAFLAASCAVGAATYSGSDMPAIGASSRRGLQAIVNAVQTQPWRYLPSAIGQQCGVSTSCASMQAQPQLDVQDAPVSTAEAQGSQGAFELGAIRNDWRCRPSYVMLRLLRCSGSV